MDEMIALDSTVESIIVDGCNLESFTVLNLTRFVNLKVFEVNDDSFAYVKEVHISGLSKLDRVVIGVNCFTKYKNSWGKDSTRHFYLKDCPQLRELRLGRYSFSDYASLELKSEM